MVVGVRRIRAGRGRDVDELDDLSRRGVVAHDALARKLDAVAEVGVERQLGRRGGDQALGRLVQADLGADLARDLVEHEPAALRGVGALDHAAPLAHHDLDHHRGAGADRADDEHHGDELGHREARLAAAQRAERRAQARDHEHCPRVELEELIHRRSCGSGPTIGSPPGSLSTPLVSTLRRLPEDCVLRSSAQNRVRADGRPGSGSVPFGGGRRRCASPSTPSSG